MDGLQANAHFLQERRRRLAAERMLDRTRHELTRAHSALVANADRLSRDYLSTREENLRLSDRQKRVLAERKEAAEKADRARRRLWHALEAMRDGFALFDRDNRLVAANSVYLDLFDTASEIAPGAPAADLFAIAADEGAFDTDGEDPDVWSEEQIALWDADPIVPRVLHTFDGRAIRFQERRAPDGDLVSLAVDISDIEARENSLAAARDSAEEAARAKAAFLARMSHEMRTPMNGVLGLAEMLASRDLDEESKEFARTIRDSAEALLVIVNDTLDVSRLEAERIELRAEPFDLEYLLIDCLRLARATRKGDAVQVALDYPLSAPRGVIGDEGRLRQIVMNLLGNALKFTDEGHVAVHVRITPETEGQIALSLTIEDTGPGIPDDERAIIFEAFGQVENGRPQKEGTGLGLTISRGLAEKMGGTIRLLESDGIGSRFELTIRLAQSAEPLPNVTLPDAVRIPLESGIVGDVLAMQLEKEGCRVVRDDRVDDLPILVPLSLEKSVQTELVARLTRPVPMVLIGTLDRAVPELADARSANIRRLYSGADVCSALQQPARTAKLSEKPPETETLARARPLLLVADDNATNRFLLEKMLATEAFDLMMVADGAEAVEAHGKALPDLVLLDISMPVMDGMEAAGHIHAADAAAGRPPTPLIALTAHTGDEMEQKLLSCGFVSHQTKPVRKPELLAAILDTLGACSGV